MKKFVSVMLTLALACSLTACAKGQQGNVQTPAPQKETIAYTLLDDFKEKAAKAEYNTSEKLAQALLENQYVPFEGKTEKVVPGALRAFTIDIEGFDEAAMFAPVDETIPFIGYIFKTSEGVDIDEFIETLKYNADLDWNDGKQADEMMIDVVDNTVLFIMSPTSFN